jgi:ketosteroid isomerase-like protein
MRATILLALAALLASPGAQAPAFAQAPAPSPEEQLVRRWVERWNALGSSPAATDALVELYAPDALHITGPTADQRGTATYRGPDGVRSLAGKVTASQEKLAWRLETETASERTATLLHATSGPWGGPAVGVQLVAVYTDRASGKRYVVPGAAFFQVAEGKIRRLRLYLADGERAEVEPERKKP